MRYPAIVSQTTRLTLRQLTPADSAPLQAMLSDPEVMRYSVGGVHDQAATQRFLDWCCACYRREDGLGPWALVRRPLSVNQADSVAAVSPTPCADGEFIGFCGLAPERLAEGEQIALGYRLARPHWGVGLATEAVTTTLHYAFAVCRLPQVIAIVEPDHGASLRVVEKAGFSQRQRLAFHGREVWRYAITQAEWRDRPPQEGGEVPV